ncbi:MAG: hypothetical protein RR621_07965 [Lachnospiraceae bacterium]
MHSSRKYIRSTLFIILCVSITTLLYYAVVPSSIARVELHNLRSQSYDDLFIGGSHGLSSINPEVIDQQTKKTSTNLCLPGEYMRDSYYIVKEACRTYKPRRIIYELDPSYWSTPENSGVNATYIYKNLPFSSVKIEYFFNKMISEDWRNTLSYWYYYKHRYPEIQANIQIKNSKDYQNYGVEHLSTDTQIYTKEGYLYQKKPPNSLPQNPEFVLWNETTIQENQEIFFKKLVGYCKKEQIELVAITTPVPQETLDKYPEVYDSANRYFTELMKKNGVNYRDFNVGAEDEIDRNISGYVDYEGHMSGELGNQFSVILGQYLNHIPKVKD